MSNGALFIADIYVVIFGIEYVSTDERAFTFCVDV